MNNEISKDTYIGKTNIFVKFLLYNHCGFVNYHIDTPTRCHFHKPGHHNAKGSDKRISWNSSELLSEYIWMPKNWPSEYPNIFELPWIDRTNIRIFMDTKELNKQISEYIRIGEKPQIQIWIIIVDHFIGIFKYSIICAHYWKVAGWRGSWKGLMEADSSLKKKDV